MAELVAELLGGGTVGRANQVGRELEEKETDLLVATNLESRKLEWLRLKMEE